MTFVITNYPLFKKIKTLQPLNQLISIIMIGSIHKYNQKKSPEIIISSFISSK